MEENKKVVCGEKGASSSSFTSELFGEKGGAFQSSASTEIFSSIFASPSLVPGRNSLTSELMESLQKHSRVQEWNKEIPDEMVKMTEGKKSYTLSSPIFQEVDPCPLSSSLYYGGQEDMYIQSSSTPSFGSHKTCKKNKGEDNPSSNNQSASTGNMWEGSLYY